MNATTPTPKLSAVALAVWNKTIIMLRRYTFNTITQLISIYVLFLIMFMGIRGIGGAVGGNAIAVGDTLDATIVGFFMFFVVFGTYGSLSQTIMNEARLGTLEQLMMTPFGFRKLAGFEVLTNIVVQLVMSGVMLVAMLFTTGRTLHIDVATVLPLMLLSATTAVGIGFAFAGLALMFKRIEALFMVMQFVFVGLVSAPAFTKSALVLALLPVSLSSLLLNEAMTDGLTLLNMGADRLALAVLSSAFCYAAGLLVFSRMERSARDSGNLAQY